MSILQILNRYNPRLTVGLEEMVDGKVTTETEIILYGRLTDLEQLKKANSCEQQEQWSILIKGDKDGKGKGSVRVRMIKEDAGDPKYVQAVKVKRNEHSSLEVESEATKDVFEMIKFLSDGGMIKDRYRFEIEGSGLVWEVDVFKKEDGSYHEWVKIDLETDTPDAALPELPIEFAELITPDDLKGDKADIHNKTLDILYKDIFRAENPYRNGSLNEGDIQTAETETPDTTVEETEEEPVFVDDNEGTE